MNREVGRMGERSDIVNAPFETSRVSLRFDMSLSVSLLLIVCISSFRPLAAVDEIKNILITGDEYGESR